MTFGMTAEAVRGKLVSTGVDRAVFESGFHQLGSEARAPWKARDPA
jgi:hypothetical protein